MTDRTREIAERAANRWLQDWAGWFSGASHETTEHLHSDLSDAIEAAIREAEARWVPVRKPPQLKKPGYYGQNLYLTWSDGEWSLCLYRGDGRWEYEDGSDATEFETHWQPLPSPPEE